MSGYWKDQRSTLGVVLLGISLASVLVFAASEFLRPVVGLAVGEWSIVSSLAGSAAVACLAAMIAQWLLGLISHRLPFGSQGGRPSNRLVVSVLVSQVLFALSMIAISAGVVQNKLEAQLKSDTSEIATVCADWSRECLARHAGEFSGHNGEATIREDTQGHIRRIVIATGTQETLEVNASAIGWLYTVPALSIELSGTQSSAASSTELLFQPHHLEASWRTFLAAIVTACLIACLICIECAVFLRARGGAHAESEGYVKEKIVGTDYRLMRPAIFLFLFGIDLSMAFIPLYTESLFEPMFGLSKDVVMGLPISFEFLCVGVAILVAGAWFDKRGWQEPFYVGLVLAGVGGICSWLADDAIEFILSRGLVGFGYGLAQLSSHGFVIKNTDSKTKAQGLSHLAAGLYSGSICGAAAGAVMADYYSYEVVFAVSAAIIFSVVLYGISVLGLPSLPLSEKSGAAKDETEARPGAIWRYLTDRGVLAAIFFSSMPASIAVVGYLNYFSPVYLDRLRISESTIGQVLMLFGICLTLLGPVLGRLIDNTDSKKSIIVVGSVIGSCSFLSFALWDGILAVAVAVLMLGISNCLVLSAQSVYVLNRDVSQELGQGKALAIFRSSSRIGQMLGPLVFAWIVLSDSPVDGVFYFGVAYLCAVVMFVIVAGKDRAKLAMATEG